MNRYVMTLSINHHTYLFNKQRKMGFLRAVGPPAKTPVSQFIETTYHSVTYQALQHIGHLGYFAISHMSDSSPVQVTNTALSHSNEQSPYHLNKWGEMGFCGRRGFGGAAAPPPKTPALNLLR
jgi:hypothetical protein